MGRSPSIRSCSRARTSSQRGFALLSAIALAVLYFALIELMLVDSSRELREAQRFRSRIVAAALAENGAELAAAKIIERAGATVSSEDWQGKVSARMTRNPAGQFQITADAETKGVMRETASVRLYGRIVGNDVRIQYSIHKP